MKRILAFLVCISVLLSGMVFVEASNSADAVVDLIKADYRYDYDAESDIVNEFVNISFRVTNLPESYKAYVAFYTDQNQLRDFKSAENPTISADGSAEFLVESDVSIEEEGISVKVFVWDDNYAPCADIVPYSIDKGNTTISVAGTTIQNKSFNTLTITEEIGDGEVTLNNVSVGELIVEGGGSNSIKLKGCTVRNKITAQKKSGAAPRILLENTPVDKIEIIKPAIIEASDTTSVISEIMTVEEVKIQGANTRVKKLEIDEKTEKEIGIGVPDGMELELEINSDNGFELIEGTADNFEFSTVREDIAEEILETIKDIVSHIHIWKEEAEITLGYKTYKCSCSEIKNPSDRVVSFNVSDFASLDSSAGELKYFSDKENGIMSSARLDIDPEKASDFILYNGSAFESKNPVDYFGSVKLIDVNSYYSGRVVLIDNDFEAGYDVISIEMPVYGIVETVNSNGRVVFKNAPIINPMGGRANIIFVSGENCNSVLTKNSKIISGSELKENDVLSVMWNPNKEFYYVEVVDNKVEGSVTMIKPSITSAYATAFCLNGIGSKAYDVGANAYNGSGLKLGAEGAFVIDKYDKIVAFFKPTSNMHGNYGYVLAATEVVDDWGNLNVRMQILDDSGEVYDTYLADEVEIPNAPAPFIINTFVEYGMFVTWPPTGDVYKIADFALDTRDAYSTVINECDNGATQFAATIQNQLITYEANAEGKIDTIGFATTSEDIAETNGWLYKAAYSTLGNSYDQEESQLIANGRFDITDDTLVFCINGNSGSLELGDYTMASKALSGVTDREILSKISDTTPVAVYDVNEYDEASVVVIYNVDYEKEETGGEQVSTDCGYGYVLAATEVVDDWGNLNVRMQILDDSGEVYETCLANEVEISNNASIVGAFRKVKAPLVAWDVYDVLTTSDVDTYSDVFELADLIPDLDDEERNVVECDNSGATVLKTALINQLITYKTNATGKISGIGFATWDEDAAETYGCLYQARYSTSGNSYDEADSDISVGGGIPFIVTEKTKVFCINGKTNLSGIGDYTMASKALSGVTDREILSKISDTTPVAVYDVNDSDEASVVVIYNVDYEKEETGGEQVSTDCGYGYVLAATEVVDDWGNLNVRMQILDDSGEVYETCLAEDFEVTNNISIVSAFRTTAANPSVGNNYDVLTTGDVDTDSDVFELAALIPDLDDEELTAVELTNSGATTLKNALINQLITYETNASGGISGIGFATWDEDAATEKGWLWKAAYNTSGNSYDDEDKEITIEAGVNDPKFNVTEDTKVFYINSENGNITGLGDYTAASKTASMVAKIGSIGSIPVGTPVAVYDVNENDEAAVVILYNMIAGISSNANVAVIDSVGSAIDENGQKVAYVEYFMNGERRSATTYVNLPTYSKAAISAASQGDVFKFAFDESGKKIMTAQQCIDYSGYAYTNLPNSAVVMPSYNSPISNIMGGISVVYGPAIKYNSAYKRITLADVLDVTCETGVVKVGNANVYVFDQNKIANRLYVGEASDINVDKDVIEKTPSQYITDRNGNIIVDTNDSVVGLLDYVAGFKNADGEVIDVVIYKPYDFGIYYVY